MNKLKPKVKSLMIYDSMHVILGTEDVIKLRLNDVVSSVMFDMFTLQSLDEDNADRDIVEEMNKESDDEVWFVSSYENVVEGLQNIIIDLMSLDIYYRYDIDFDNVTHFDLLEGGKHKSVINLYVSEELNYAVQDIMNGIGARDAIIRLNDMTRAMASGFDIEDETFIADVTEMIDAAKEEQDARIVIDIVKEAEKKGLLNEKKEDKKIDEKDIDKYIIAMHEDVSKELEKEESDPGWNVKLDMRDGSVEVCIKYNDIDDTKEFVLDNKYTVFTRISNHIEQFVPRLKVIINIRPEAQQELFSGSVIRFIHNGKIITDYKEGATAIAVPDTIETVDEYIDLVMNSYKKNKE